MNADDAEVPPVASPRPDPSFDPPPKLPPGGLRPYAGTSGRGGSKASAASKARQDADGTTTARQSRALELLALAGPVGLTYREVCERTGWVGGQATGALSVLHKEGLIARLEIRRGNCSVYVAPDQVDDRPVSPYRPNRSNRPVLSELTIEESIIVHNFRLRIDFALNRKTPVFTDPAEARLILAIVDRLTKTEEDE